MSVIEIYDKPMCCSTGICGPQVDPVLPRFAADLDWLRMQGHQVERFNLSHNPAAFAANEDVKRMLAEESVACLPLIFVDGQVASKASYPTREQLTELAERKAPGPASSLARALPVTEDANDCCGGTNCS